MKRLIAVMSLLLFTVGCDSPAPVAKAAPSKTAPPAPPPPPGWQPPAAETPAAAPATLGQPKDATSNQAPVPIETKAGVFAGSLDDLAGGGGFSNAATPPVPTEIVEAQKGVGLKGRSLDEYEGIVVTPAKTLFLAKERISFEIEVPHALNLYDAANGAPPKTHEEFMQGVIQANNIKLPQLPPGHEYLYDPDKRQLMVKRPVKKTGGTPKGD